MSKHFDMPALNDDEMAFRFWCASGGLMGHLAKLLRQAVWDACDEGTRKITLEQFEAAHKAAIWAESGVVVVDSPFDRKFTVEPTQEKVAQALTVGLRETETEPTQRRRGNRTGAATPLSQVLKGSGP
jgi:hypothetical protein